MSLQSNNNSLKGIYQGQGDTAVEIGTQSSMPFNTNCPFVCGTYIGGDSIEMNVFFDPTLSPQANAHNVPYNKIAIIQIGSFRLNNKELPIKFYQFDNQYPATPNTDSWLDTCAQKSNNEENDDPTFPAWNYAGNARISREKLYRYPNDFGGCVRYNKQKPINYKIGDNLCAYMHSNLIFDSGNGGSDGFTTQLTIYDFIDNLDISGYELEETGLKVEEIDDSYCNDIIKYFVSKQVIPTPSVGYLLTKIRILLYWGSEDDGCYIILIPLNGTFKILWYSNDLLEDFRTAKKNSAPDISAILKNIEKQYKYSMMETDELSVSYDMYTCACAMYTQIDAENKPIKVNFRLFEGFAWNVTNQFTDTKQWQNLQFCPLKQENSEVPQRRSALKYALMDYYSSIYGNKVQVVIHDDL
jgi:hypothetical protein